MKNTIAKTMLLLSAFATMGLAENVTIRIPFAFSAAGKSLPAGEYTFQEESPGVMVVTGATPGSSMLMLTRGGDASVLADKAGVTFSDTRALTCIHMPDGKKVEVLRTISPK
jgi:hypothetical protein